ncbi:hypothetical protein HHO41_17940 [Bacillus sp. DNRA2]|uniref:hypothetical protein n=1 Tax=Bacillus sp. DNRA2 TaxID=2723053 RepID=UPI00145D81EC|nr:hypothetical protein [Bacillus sp. DNRA2]NMD72160.1 hypothetical protein [Bacillus sp. DNRA2]
MTDYVYLLVGSMVTMICFYFMAAPFFKREGAVSQALAGHEQEISIELIYAAVNELEMDFLMKKITEADFLHLKQRYQMMAAEYLKMEEQQIRIETDAAPYIDEDILLELQEIRNKKGRNAG